MKLLKELLFGVPAQPVCQFKDGVQTIYPSNQPDEWTWKQEFKVGMLYDKKPVYLD